MRQRNRIELAKPFGLGVFLLGTGTACPMDELPPCPGQCFDYTLERSVPIACYDDEANPFPIAFTNTDLDGYLGRTCFNSPSVPLVVEAIEHIQAGGQLSTLSMEVVGAYASTVNAVRADLEAECILAAPGQCTNAAAVCSVIGARAYEQLVIDATCVLSLDGTEPVALAPGQTCAPVAEDRATGSDEDEDHCPGAPSSTTGLDDTAGSDGLDDTSDDTGMMASPRRAAP
jgi:hypothetical protein